jgi:hypothetical protein
MHKLIFFLFRHVHCEKATYNVTKAYNLLNIKITKTLILLLHKRVRLGQYASATVFKAYWVAPVFHHKTMLCLVCYSIKNNFFLHEFSNSGRWAAKLLARVPAPSALCGSHPDISQNSKIIVATKYSCLHIRIKLNKIIL